MKILLIDPSRYKEGGRLIKSKQLAFPPLTLPLLAALVPHGIEVVIKSETFEEIDFDEKADVVGITAYTSRILRAYEIADEFRRRGVYVVMGGCHVTMEEEEALEHCDTLIAGEAEETWPEFIMDFKQGAAKKLYCALKRPSLGRLPLPRFDLLPLSRYLSCSRRGYFRFLPTPMLPVQTSRGCPHSCDYCSVTLFFGGLYRMRPILEVIEEIKAHGIKGCLFIDDNIFAIPQRAKELFRALIPLKISWVGQGTISAAEDGEMVALARKSGCVALFVGLESIVSESVNSVGKYCNRVNEYARSIRTFRQAGISLMASMIFGLDGEDSGTFKKTYAFLVHNNVTYTLWHPLCPFPGTPLLKRLRTQGRLKQDKWWLNQAMTKDFLVMKYQGLVMSEEQFRAQFIKYYKAFYSRKSILRRICLPPQKRFLLKLLLNFNLKGRIAAATSMLES